MMELLANDIVRMALLALLFLAVVAVVYGLVSLLEERHEMHQRLVTSRTPTQPDFTQPGAGLRVHDARGAWVSLVTAIENAGIPLVDTKDATIRSRLVAAGYTQEYAPRIYTLVRLAMVIGLPLGAFALLWAGGNSPSLMKLYLIGLIAAALGLYIPNLWIRIKADRRQREIINGFPDALDLMLVCVEAGLGLEAAFSRVGMEMTRSHPLLAEQLGAVVLELRAGRSQEDALRRMADRAGADEIRAFSTLLIQSHKLGSSVAQTLRIYAAEMRERRRMRAEEKAHRLPVLLSIPLVTCMLPVMIGVLMLPAVIRTIRVLVPALGGD
ncbi:type II secretion system F family protein [Sphingomonas sp. NSE70-1]|uniref:Type II secretion system F family protein n=1 Tax=Sphingomonas caseinilyticus TaxID=2908205 RepID=A0ABT0RV59_9SPHN|nr:type II secretion system F family protein [Sphingomonas caseinilyticus]MCL6698915.1 type II secretion system F family protein [Sphingomonas caseinilyticus]